MSPLLVLRGLVAGRVRRRYQRFLADVELEDAQVVTAHCTNTGTMAGCWAPGDTVLLLPVDAPHRRLKFTWVACRRGRTWVGVDTGVPNKVVAEAARRDQLPGLPGLRDVRTEVPYGRERSRVDVAALDSRGREVLVEVKNTTLRQGSMVLFPDAATERGTKHLRELRGVVEAGGLAAIAFFVNRGDVSTFDAAREVDPGYAEELHRAAAAGVLVLPLKVRLRARRDPSGAWSLAWSLDGLHPWTPRT
ncbi:MAG: DNA/RNA nuclease SfsA [Acidobacteria bacterium]|nr:DNA/RNA nuclease SfsA [Acidobacteriota bacterium]